MKIIATNTIFFYNKEGENVIEAANLMAQQLQKVMELDEFKAEIGKKLALLEKRLDRIFLFTFYVCCSQRNFRLLCPLCKYACGYNLFVILGRHEEKLLNSVRSPGLRTNYVSYKRLY